jgi:hypothetical protein
VGKPEGEDYYDGVYVRGRIILKSILQKYDGVVQTGFIWLRIGTSSGLF